MRAAVVALMLAAGAYVAIPREVVRIRCLQASQSCMRDDIGPICITDLTWVTRDGPAGDDILAPTCHKAWMWRWLGVEWFDRNADGKPGYFQMADAP